MTKKRFFGDFIFLGVDNVLHQNQIEGECDVYEEFARLERELF